MGEPLDLRLEGVARSEQCPNPYKLKSAKTVTLTAADIRGFLKVPAHAEATIWVPGGGDWSNTDLRVSEKEDDDQCVRVTYCEEKEQ